MKKIFRKLLGGVLLLSLSMSLTSCEGALDDILGEWSRPASIKEGTFSYATTSQVIGITVGDFVNPITIEGDGKVTYSSSDPTIAEVDPETGVITPHKTGTVTITATITDGRKYAYETKEISYTLKVNLPIMKWDDTNKKLVEADAEDGAMVMPAESELADVNLYGDKGLPAGTYIIAEDMTFNKTIRLSGDVDIILCDGKTLTLNCLFVGNNHELNIYGQSENTGTLKSCKVMSGYKPLNVYGGIIDIESNHLAVIGAYGMNVYGGTVNAISKSNSSGSGIQICSSNINKLTIYGGSVTAKGTTVGGYNSSYGIAGDYDGGFMTDVIIYGGSLEAVGYYAYSGHNAIKGNLTVMGGSVSVYDSSGSAVSGNITAGAGVTLEESDDATDATSWAPISSTSSTKMYIRTKQ